MPAKYGGAHQRLRARLLATMINGQPCARCGYPMWRTERRLLEADHLENGTVALSHRACNRSHGGRKGRAAQLAAAGQRAKPLLRPCCACGKAFSPSTMETITCGAPECVAALRRRRRERGPDPVPPVSTGRRW